MDNSDDVSQAGDPGPPSPPAIAAPPASFETAPGEYQRLDPRVVNYWRVHQLVVTAVLLGALFVPAFILVFNFRGTAKWAAAGWLAVLMARLCFIGWYAPRAYRAWGYRIDGRVLETRQGIWFRVTQLLPLSRLQHVDLHSGPIERSFGLASLILHTAGTHDAAIGIPGLAAAEAAKLRDHLVAAGGDDGV